VIIGSTLSVALVAPAADPAVLDGLRICDEGRTGGDLLQLAPHRTVIGGEVGDAVAVLRPVAEKDVHPLGRTTLEPPDLDGVLAHLEQRRHPDRTANLASATS